MVARIECLKCNTILTSIDEHDFQQCKCSNKSFVDGGGIHYTRIGGKDMDKIKIIRNDAPNKQVRVK